jgi:hypothetical protein
MRIVPCVHDHDNGKVVVFRFGQMWLTVMVDGWPRASWQQAVDTGEHLFGRDEILGYLVQTVASEAPVGKMLTILQVSFSMTSVQHLLP